MLYEVITVVSAPSGVNCPADCEESYDAGLTVTLSADPDADSNFEAWSGAGCDGKVTRNNFV